MCVHTDEKEYIIGELENIIKDQSYRMRNNIQYDYPIPRNRISADNKHSFTYDLASDLPEINTGNQDIPFAVLPNDRRYYQPGRWSCDVVIEVTYYLGVLLCMRYKYYFSCEQQFHH